MPHLAGPGGPCPQLTGPLEDLAKTPLFMREPNPRGFGPLVFGAARAIGFEARKGAAATALRRKPLMPQSAR